MLKRSRGMGNGSRRWPQGRGSRDDLTEATTEAERDQARQERDALQERLAALEYATKRAAWVAPSGAGVATLVAAHDRRR